MIKIPKQVLQTIVGGSINQPQLIQDDTDALRFGKLNLSVHRPEPEQRRTDLNFSSVSFVSLPMSQTPIKAFSVLTLKEARAGLLAGHSALKVPKLPRETFVFVFTSDHDVAYFVIAKSMSFEPYPFEQSQRFVDPIVVPAAPSVQK